MPCDREGEVKRLGPWSGKARQLLLTQHGQGGTQHQAEAEARRAIEGLPIPPPGLTASHDSLTRRGPYIDTHGL